MVRRAPRRWTAWHNVIDSGDSDSSELWIRIPLSLEPPPRRRRRFESRPDLAHLRDAEFMTQSQGRLPAATWTEHFAVATASLSDMQTLMLWREALLRRRLQPKAFVIDFNWPINDQRCSSRFTLDQAPIKHTARYFLLHRTILRSVRDNSLPYIVIWIHVTGRCWAFERFSRRRRHPLIVDSEDGAIPVASEDI